MRLPRLLRVVLLVVGTLWTTLAVAGAPTATTSAASSLTTTTALLNGTGTPAGEAATGRFRIGTSDPGACNDTFGSRVPATGGTDLGAGGSPVPYSVTATGLVPGTTYWFCAIVTNASGTAFGTVLTFTVPAPPSVTTEVTDGLTSTAATLRGAANPRGASTTGWFRYSTTNPGACSDTFGTRAPSSGGTTLGAGAAAVAYSQAISGLTPGATYYVCAIASNTWGTSFGTVASFTTLPAVPVVATATPTTFTGSTATFTGTANPGGASTTAWFRYDTLSPGTCNDTFGTRAPASGGSDLGSGNATVGFSQGVTGLTPGTTYYVCAIGQNSAGSGFGSVASFTTALPPTVVTGAASAITNASGTLNGSANPNRAAATGWFRYSATHPGTCNDTFGSRAPTSSGTSLGAGSASVGYAQSVSGLSSGVTYWYCAIASSSEGTSFGTLASFTTLAAPTAATAPASLLTATTATLNGVADPNGATATGWFRYATVDPGTCNDTFGTRAPSSSGSALGAGTDDVAFSQAIGSLLPNTTYYACAIANNAYGTALGGVVSFTTPPAAPTASTGAVTTFTGTTATFNGTANPGGDATTGWFRYATVSPGTCNDTFGTRAPAAGGSPLGAGTSSVAFSQAVTGLTPGATYYVCAIAQNGVGTAWGSVRTFTTALPPTASTSAASSVASTSATLNGSGTPNLAATTGWFRYATTNPGVCGDSFGSRAPATGGTALGTGSSPVAFAQSVSGLSAGTTYWFCAITESAEGKAFGTVLSFTTAGAPAVVTTATTAITATGATLNGSANPNLATTTAWFRYAATDPGTCSDSFGTRAPLSSGGTSLGAGSAPVTFNQPVSGLTPATTYWVCAIASNAYGTSFGAPVSFTTPPAAPTASTSAVTAVTGTTATFNGSTNPGGDATTAWFRYGTVSPGTCNDSFGTRTPTTGGTAIPAGNGSVAFSQAVTGLTPGATYYVCAIAQNSVGTAFGSLRTFTTALPPTAATAAASSVANTSATLNGSANPNLAATTGWFRYSATNPGACDDTFGSRAPGTGGTSLGAGSGSVAFAQSVSGLSAGTTYWFCAIAESAEGKAFGTVLSFTTPSAPTVTTSPATLATSTTATLNGSATPNLATATGWFRYSTSDPGTCSDTFGTRAPLSSGGTSLGAGAAPVAYSQPITGLAPATTYWFCALASNAYGTSFGPVTSFTTLPAAPTASTSAVGAITGTTATFNGSVNPGGDAATGWFRYASASPGTCNDTFGTRAPASGGTAFPPSNATTSYSQGVTGLTPGATYYVCAIAQNSVGTAFGSVRTFTTPLPPTVSTNAASGVTNTAATLNGTANPNLATTSGWFRYATTQPAACDDAFGSRAPTSGGVSLGSGGSPTTYGQSISGLSAGTTYWFCAIVESAEGKAFGAVTSFTTAGPPTATTTAATAVTSSGATLNGAANPNLGTTTGWFRYASTNPGTCSDAFGTRAPSSSGTSLGAGATSTPYGQPIAGLLPGTTYWYCAIASNAYGTGLGPVLSFTTLPAAPTVVTSSVTPFAGTTATLNGSVNPGGDATTGWFRYATVSPGTCNDTFGTRAPTSGGSAVPAGNASVAFSQAVTGLTPGTTYYVCAIAQNGVGTNWGSVVTFTTALPPVTATAAASSVSNTTATLNGSANPNRAATTGWFRYATSDPGTCDDAFGSRAPAVGGSSLGSGSNAVAFAQGLTGLSPGTTYWACAIAGNVEGTGFGALVTFTTPTTPTVTTSATTAVTATTATLNGAANPNLASATGWFRYATTNPGTCNDTFGTRAPSSSGTGLGAGAAAVPYTQGIASLLPGTTYWVCAIASNAYGTSVGTPLSFTTPPTAPVVVTGATTGISSVAATLGGTVNPGGDAATAWFRYATASPGTCNDTFGTRAPATGGTALAASNSTSGVTQAISGLAAGTTYYVCAIAQNSVGTSFGTVQSFTTPLPPVVTTSAASSVTNTTATLNGSANPNRAATTGWFRYATSDPGACDDTFGSRTPTTGGSSLGSGSSPVAYSQSVSGLSAGTTYWYCAVASSSEGTSSGTVLTFTTASPPIVTTAAATVVTAATATLNGSANPNGATATGWFRYSTTSPGTCNDSFGTRAPTSSGASLGGGAAPVAYSQPITGLIPGTTYYVCAVASSAYGTSWGAPLSFTTPPTTPVVSTSAVSGLTPTTATLNGSANPGGAPTTAWFRYDTVSPGTCNDTFGTRAPGTGGTALGGGNTGVAFGQPLTGLSPGTTYYVCAIAENSVGTGFGAVVTVSTPRLPTVATLAATPVTATAATLNASGTAYGNATTGWFRYGTTDPGACTDAFGTRTPSSGGSSLGSGTSPVAFSQAITGLQPGATYYVCAIVSNTIGTAFGEVLSFTTPPLAPSVTSVAATGVGISGATIRGSATPNGAATSGWFRYGTTNPGTCTDAFGLRTPASGGAALGAGNAAVAYETALTGLALGQTYWYCAAADNAVGTTYGAVLSFTTTAAPVVTTSAPSVLAGTSATLAGAATPNGASSTGWFRYATVDPGTCNDTFGTRAPGTGGTALGAGTTAVPYTAAVTGLVRGTTYYVCAVAQNASGTGFGDVVRFTTPAAPTVTTDAIADLTGSSVTLNGSGVPRGSATTAWFRYGTTSPGTCNDTFGTRAPGSGGTALGAGAVAVPFSQPLAGLAAGTTYHVCAIAQNAEGTSWGAVVSFRTPSAPAVTTVSATATSGALVAASGSATPNGAATDGWFRYGTVDPGTCNDTFGDATPARPLGGGSTAVAFSADLTGLVPGTTYHVCAIARNSVGTAFGAVLHVTTPTLPTVATLAPTAVTPSGATLEGSATPRGAAATGWFRLGTSDPGTCDESFGSRVPTSGGVALGAGASAVAFDSAVTGLQPATTYWACAVASNSEGTAHGLVVSFTTPSAPTVTTVAATPVGSTTATLRGTVDPEGTTTTVWFRYATTNPGTCSDAFGTRAPGSGGTAVGAGTDPVDVGQALTGLQPGTTYWYCALASSTWGTRTGELLSFRTTAAPTVATRDAGAVDTTSATLNGDADPNLAATEAWFRYATTAPASCNDTFGTRAPAGVGVDVGAGDAAVPYSQGLVGLTPGTTYHFCAVARNAVGTSFGTVRSFTTSSAPTVATLAATGLTSSTATLQGTADPNGLATVAWFRHDTVAPAACDDTFGVRTPASGGTDVGAGTSPVAFTADLTGLAPHTTVYYCAIATSAAGTTFGAVLSLTTSDVPTVTTTSAVATSRVTARVEALGNPQGADATGWFRYDTTAPVACDDSFGVLAPPSGVLALGAGTADVPFGWTLSGLTPGQTYYVCALVRSAEGTAYGEVLSFRTPSAPTVVTLDADAVSGDGATLRASVNPNLADTGAWFRLALVDPGVCSDAFGTRHPTGAELGVGAGGDPVTVELPVTGLAPRTTYWVCVLATSAEGTALGELVTFTTGAATPTAPTVVTDAATDVFGDGATLHGAADPNGTATTGWFRLADVDPGACDDTFGQRVPATGGTALGSGLAPVAFAEVLTGLQPGRTYWFCALAENAGGVATGALQTFTLGVEPPTVVTLAPRDVAGSTAVLVGAADPNGTDAVGWFRYGDTEPVACDDTFGVRVPSAGGADLGSGPGDVSFEEAIADLLPNATYYACAAASNLGGAAFGDVVAFTTAAVPPAVSTRPASVEGEVVHLSGGANPQGSATIGWFRYASADPGGCDDTFGTRLPATGGVDLGDGRVEAPFADAVTGLAPGTWYVCALGSNDAGVGYGELVTVVVPDGGGGDTDTGGDDDGKGSCGCRLDGGDPRSLAPALGLLLLALRRRRRA